MDAAGRVEGAQHLQVRLPEQPHVARVHGVLLPLQPREGGGQRLGGGAVDLRRVEDHVEAGEVVPRGAEKRSVVLGENGRGEKERGQQADHGPPSLPSPRNAAWPARAQL